MGWNKLREVGADSNAYDRYQGSEGAAVVYKQGRNLFGFTSTHGAWGPVPVPTEGNVQAVRIVPTGFGWRVYAYTDPRDGVRAEWSQVIV